MTVELDALRWQFSLTWTLAEQEHLPKLTDAACLWQPVAGCWTVHRGTDGRWRPDFADVEPDAPPSIGWLTWHVIWWWSDALAVLRGAEVTPREQVYWPGSAAATVAELRRIAGEWSALLDGMAGAELTGTVRLPGSVELPVPTALAWVNGELMKNVAEIGYARMLHAARGTSG